MKKIYKELGWGAAIIILLTLLAYIPAIQGGYIWDDDAHVTRNQALRTWDGLRSIWLEPLSLPQYYPLVHTTFWVEYQLWQLQPMGYHLVNVVLHSLNAILVWVLLRRLSVPGAWFAAAVFALHPVHVESVAWITERKNVLSGCFYLASILAYIRFCGLSEGPAKPVAVSSRRNAPAPVSVGPDWRCYGLACGLFVCALLSKTVTCSMPAVILLLVWWKRGRLQWRDVVPLLPLFVVGVVFGYTTAWLERHHVGARGDEFDLSVVERILIAGRAVWFYAGKLFWPDPLIFMYPRWRIDAGVWWQYLFPLTALSLVVSLFALRARIGRGPLIAVLFFGGTLVPALGFVDVFPMRYSFVADHFQYLASLGLIVLFAASAANLVKRLGSKANGVSYVAAAFVLVALGNIGFKQCPDYRNAETLWKNTLAKNPDSWMSHNNLGVLLADQGKYKDAIWHYSESLRLKPDHEEAHNNLGSALLKQGKATEAVAEFSEALRLRPNFADAHSNMGWALSMQGKVKEAIEHHMEALRIRPNYAEGHNNLGATLLDKQGKVDEAIDHFAKAVRIKPQYADAHFNMGVALDKKGRTSEAVDHYLEAVKNKPVFAAAHHALGIDYQKLAKTQTAIKHFREALRIRPNWTESLRALAWILATDEDDALRNGAEAVKLAERACQQTGYKQSRSLDALAAAHAEAGDFGKAVEIGEKALELAPNSGRGDGRVQIASRLELYRNRQPYRQSQSSEE